jgi:hypothetical protein
MAIKSTSVSAPPDREKTTHLQQKYLLEMGQVPTHDKM